VTHVEVRRIDRRYDVGYIWRRKRSAHVSKLKQRLDHTESHRVMHALEGAEANTRYEEYVRALDELPVLADVVREPPRVVIRNFRLGQRPDVRKRPREDAYSLREQYALDLEQWYGEYAQDLAAPAKPAKRVTARKPAQKKRSSKPRKRAKR